jgi:hypothetical protein
LFSVTLSSEGSGTVSGNSGLIEEGQEISVLATPDFGYEFIAWSGSYDSSENPITFNVNSTVELIAVFKRKTVSEDFEDDSQRLQLVHGSAPWFITDETSMTGESSLRSAVIGNSESTSLKLTTNLSDGRGKFDVKVSSEEGWDTLTFLIDGVPIRSWSGEVPWERFEFDLKADSSEAGISNDENISSKSYTLQWIYSKDFANSSGLDAAFLDNIDLPIATNNSSQQPAFVYVQPSSDGSLDIEVVGQPGRSYSVEVSKSLQTWEVIHRGLADSEGRMQLRGVSGGGKAQSFYRAVTE